MAREMTFPLCGFWWSAHPCTRVALPLPEPMAPSLWSVSLSLSVRSKLCTAHASCHQVAVLATTLPPSRLFVTFLSPVPTFPVPRNTHPPFSLSLIVVREAVGQ